MKRKMRNKKNEEESIGGSFRSGASHEGGSIFRGKKFLRLKGIISNDSEGENLGISENPEVRADRS